MSGLLKFYQPDSFSPRVTLPHSRLLSYLWYSGILKVLVDYSKVGMWPLPCCTMSCSMLPCPVLPESLPSQQTCISHLSFVTYTLEIFLDAFDTSHRYSVRGGLWISHFHT